MIGIIGAVCISMCSVTLFAVSCCSAITTIALVITILCLMMSVVGTPLACCLFPIAIIFIVIMVSSLLYAICLLFAFIPCFCEFLLVDMPLVSALCQIPILLICVCVGITAIVTVLGQIPILLICMCVCIISIITALSQIPISLICICVVLTDIFIFIACSMGVCAAIIGMAMLCGLAAVITIYIPCAILICMVGCMFPMFGWFSIPMTGIWGTLILGLAMGLGTLFIVALCLGAFLLLCDVDILSAGRPSILSLDIRKKRSPVQYMGSPTKVEPPKTPTARRSVAVGRVISDFGYPDVVAPTMVKPVEPARYSKPKKGKIPLLVVAAVASTISYLTTGLLHHREK